MHGEALEDSNDKGCRGRLTGKDRAGKPDRLKRAATLGKRERIEIFGRQVKGTVDLVEQLRKSCDIRAKIESGDRHERRTGRKSGTLANESAHLRGRLRERLFKERLRRVGMQRRLGEPPPPGEAVRPIASRCL